MVKIGRLRQLSRRRAILAGIGTVTLTSLGGRVASAPTDIDACTTIEESGEYRLTRDLEADGDCLIVEASDVTIDGNGHTIRGDGSGAGITIKWGQLTLNNLGIESFDIAIDSGGANIDLSQIECRKSDTIINTAGATGIQITVQQSRLADGAIRSGVNQTFFIAESYVSDCSILVDTGTAMDASGCTFMRSPIIGGEAPGIHLKRTDVINAPNHGIEVGMKGTIHVDQSSIRDSAGDGIHMMDGETNITVSDSALEANEGSGIVFYGGGNITGNTIRNNRHGISIQTVTTDSIVRENVIEDNKEYGIRTLRGDAIDATCNYWGHATGPRHADNPNGQGDRVSDDVIYTPWRVESDGPCVGGEEDNSTPTPTPTQTPSPTPEPTPTPDQTPTPTPEPTPTPTPDSTPTPTPTPEPSPTPTPTPSEPTPTPSPTPADQTPTPTPTPTPGGPTPTPSPTPTDSSPTPAPTPTPEPQAAPTPTPHTTPTPVDGATPRIMATPTPEDEQLPGFGILGALASLGGAGYVIYRRWMADDTEST